MEEHNKALVTARKRIDAVFKVEKEATQESVFAPVSFGEIELSNLKLSTLPDELWKLVFIEKLFLDLNLLTYLPDDIEKFQYLEWLVLENNLLSSLPPTIKNLHRLKFLILDSNNISALPPEIGQLTSLVTLQIDDNILESLPHEIGKLSQLRTLSVQNNRLTHLPVELVQLQNLKELNVKGNPLRVPSKAIVSRGLKDTSMHFLYFLLYCFFCSSRISLSYFHNLVAFLKELASGAEPAYRCKLMFVGQGLNPLFSP